MNLIAAVYFGPNVEFYEALYGEAVRELVRDQGGDDFCSDEAIGQKMVAVDQRMNVEEFRTLTGSDDLRVLREILR